MIFYSIILLLSIGGVVTIIRRNRAEFEAFNFAEFMEKLAAELNDLWHLRWRGMVLGFTEKRLHNIRILALKTENKLFHAAKTLRGIKEKNGNGSNGNGNGNSDETLK